MSGPSETSIETSPVPFESISSSRSPSPSNETSTQRLQTTLPSPNDHESIRIPQQPTGYFREDGSLLNTNPNAIEPFPTAVAHHPIYPINNPPYPFQPSIASSSLQLQAGSSLPTGTVNVFNPSFGQTPHYGPTAIFPDIRALPQPSDTTNSSQLGPNVQHLNAAAISSIHNAKHHLRNEASNHRCCCGGSCGCAGCSLQRTRHLQWMFSQTFPGGYSTHLQSQNRYGALAHDCHEPNIPQTGYLDSPHSYFVGQSNTSGTSPVSAHVSGASHQGTPGTSAEEWTI